MKRFVSCLISILLCLPAAASAETTISETDGVRAAVLMEAQTGERLWGKEADEPRRVAGLSKLPAILTLAQAVDDGTIAASQEMTVSAHAADVPGPTAFLEKDERIAAGELIKAAVMISAGDAIMTLGENAYGSESVFMENIQVTMQQQGLPREVANALGTELTLSAWELATLGRAAADSRTFRQSCGLYLDSITHADGRETELVNANRLINQYAGASGLLTGSSQEDGYCGAFYAERNGTHLLAVVIGAQDAVRRTAAAVALLDYGFTNYRVETLSKRGEALVKGVAVRDGDVKHIDLVAKETELVVLETARGKLTSAHNAPEYLEAPLDAEIPAAEMTFTGEDGSAVATVSLYPAQSVAAFGVRDILLAIVKMFCTA